MKTLIKYLFIIFICSVAAFLGCSSDETSESNPSLINGYGTELRTCLPEVKPVTQKHDPWEPQPDSYAETQEYGGLFQRVLGDDPLSIFYMVDMTDQFISELLYPGNPDMTFGGSQTLIAPFYSDSITFEETFIYDGTHETTITCGFDDNVKTEYVTIDDFRGGYSQSANMILLSYHISVQDCCEWTAIYYGEKDSSGKLILKYAVYGGEECEEEGVSYTSKDRQNVTFSRLSASDPFTYKAAAVSIREAIEHLPYDETMFSIIMGGKIDKFIIRRRAYHNVDAFIDQFFATTYDTVTKQVGASPLDEGYSTDEFDVDGDGFTGGGLGNDITISVSDPDLTAYAPLVSADKMLDFTEGNDLPSSLSVVTPPDAWPF